MGWIIEFPAEDFTPKELPNWIGRKLDLQADPL
jgi:hypothetical protein